MVFKLLLLVLLCHFVTSTEELATFGQFVSGHAQTDPGLALVHVNGNFVWQVWQATGVKHLIVQAPSDADLQVLKQKGWQPVSVTNTQYGYKLMEVASVQSAADLTRLWNPRNGEIVIRFACTEFEKIMAAYQVDYSNNKKTLATAMVDDNIQVMDGVMGNMRILAHTMNTFNGSARYHCGKWKTNVFARM